MKQAKLFILDDKNTSASIDGIINKVLDLGYKYSIGSGLQNEDNPFYICIYDNGSAEIISRTLSSNEMPKIISLPEDFDKVINFLDNLQVLRR
jgi:hypothetical protein